MSHQRYTIAFLLASATASAQHTRGSSISKPSDRSLLLSEEASRVPHSEADQIKTYDYISIFGQSGASTSTFYKYDEFFTETAATQTQSNMIQSLHSLIENRPDLDAPTDDPTSIMLLRRETNSFADGMSVMDDNKPNARDVSNAFVGPDSVLNSLGATDMLWAFGQFANHDSSLVNVKPGELCNVQIPMNDPFFNSTIHELPLNRSFFELDANAVAQQVTNISSFISGDNIYGNTFSRLKYIRDDDSYLTGRLRTSGPNLLPKNTEGLTNRGGDARADLFLAGDVRANENLALTVMHTLWMREHNYWADALRATNPELTGDQVFYMARVIVTYEMQKVIYDEFLPALLGEDAIAPYAGYNPDVDPRMENVVSACAFRVGHTMVSPALFLDYGNKTLETIALENAFFVPSEVENRGGIDAFLRGLINSIGQEVDPFVVPAMRNHLFTNFDLVAINIQRARDHGIPDFNTIRQSLGFDKLDSFEDFSFGQELASVYSNTDQIDCWIGMNSEPRIDGLMVGETQRAVMARNFANIRDGDPNFYKNVGDPELLALIESTNLADVIRRNSDQPGSLDDVRDDVFFFHM
jgi:hypothetical protein